MKSKTIRITVLMIASMTLVTLAGCYPYPYYPYGYGYSGDDDYRGDRHGHADHWRGHHHRRHHDDD